MANRKASTPRGAQCTHMSMISLYGPFRCELCGRIPSIGFVYACEQDTIPLSPISNNAVKNRKRLGKTRRRTSADFESVGFPAWVVASAKSGHYNADQIDLLIAQKNHVHEVIAESVASSPAQKSQKAVLDKSSPSVRDELRMTSGDGKAKSKEQASSSQNSHTIPKKLRCNFKVCHACRPYCRDRAYISLEQILKGEAETLGEWYPPTMPVYHVSLIRDLGVKSRVQSGNNGDLSDRTILSPDQTSDSNGTALKERPSSYGFRASLRKSLIDMLSARYATRLSLDPNKMPVPAPGSPHQQGKQHPTTEDANDIQDDITSSVNLLERLCTTDPSTDSDDDSDHNPNRPATDFDLYLWRKLANELLQKASATALPGEDDSAEQLDLADLGLEDVEEGGE